MISILNLPKFGEAYNGFGWTNPCYHLMSWTLSSLLLTKFYRNVNLHANYQAAKLLIDVLGLPYTTVDTRIDNFSLPDSNLWAMPKVHTYSLQEQPFLHLDGDVFLFAPFEDKLLSHPLIAQNIEEATDYYTSTQKELLKHFLSSTNKCEETF